MTHVPPAAASVAHAPRLLLQCRYRGAAGCIVSLAGVAFVARPPFLFGGHEEWARTRAIGTAAGILSAVLGGGSSMTIRIIGGSEPAAVIGASAHEHVFVSRCLQHCINAMQTLPPERKIRCHLSLVAQDVGPRLLHVDIFGLQACVLARSAVLCLSCATNNTGVLPCCTMLVPARSSVVPHGNNAAVGVALAGWLPQQGGAAVRP